MQTFNNIQQLFAEWGKGEQQNPRRDFKQEILAELHTTAPAKKFRPKVLWIPTGVVAFAVIVFALLTTLNQPRYRSERTDQSEGLRYNSGATSWLGESQNYSNFVPRTLDYFAKPETPITDTREFLKKSYGANFRSRHVQDLTSRLETIIRGFNGRIDSSNSSEKSGYISFVVPADKFDSFRNELKGLVGDKFFSENTSAQNLLPEKRSIEEQQAGTQTTITGLQSQKEQLDATYAKRTQSLQSQIKDNEKAIAELQKREQTPEIQSQIQIYRNNVGSLHGQLNQESSNYQTNLNTINTQLAAQEERMQELDKQDQSLTDNVATVTGNITVSWISVWQIINLYLPMRWIIPIALLGIIVAYSIFRPKQKIILP